MNKFPEYDPNVSLDPVTHHSWAKLSVEELDVLKNNLLERVNRMQQFSESLHSDVGNNLEKLERYIMYRKGISEEDSKTIIL